MIIDCISDLHGFYPELDGGDLLIVAGDWTAMDKSFEIIKFGLWVNEQKYKQKIIVAGNHDKIIQTTPGIFKELEGIGLTYLCDSATEFNGLKIWGSPWTQWFHGINPKYSAFTLKTEEELAEKWALIPNDTDILVTHGPPYGILDQVKPNMWSRSDEDLHIGSKELLKRCLDIRLKLHVFGHIHEGYGQYKHVNEINFINASHVNERYVPVNKPIRVIL